MERFNATSAEANRLGKRSEMDLLAHARTLKRNPQTLNTAPELTHASCDIYIYILEVYIYMLLRYASRLPF